MSRWDDVKDAYVKHAHKKGCDGALYRTDGTITIDKIGRQGNGGIVAHVYRCNMAWDGCKAKVFVTERAVRLIAVSVEAHA